VKVGSYQLITYYYNTRWLEGIGNWNELLTDGDDLQELEVWRRNIKKGLPCGTDEFIRKLESMAVRILHYRLQGRRRTGTNAA
jgi:hypothetical protein